ncbi:hypothetical protein [Larkinella sp.]|uniref:hypothetical protein n=1 Tax=Larkinella sp. TaxID=2034517 RepID=UPI003BA9610F
MGTESLVNALRSVFENARKEGTEINAFMLGKAYPGFVRNSYILAVSAPSMAGWEPYEKMDKIIDLLRAHLDVQDKTQIDRVRVYNSIEELKAHSLVGFDDDPGAMYELPIRGVPQLVEI